MPTPTRKLSSALLWIALPALVILVLTFPLPRRAVASQERHFVVEASRFAYAPNVLKVNPGDRVNIDLVARDVVHGLSIDGYDLQVSSDPGQTARLTFVADRPGTFRLRCSVTCGAMHPFMLGKLQVGTNDYLWRGAGLILLVAAIGLWKGWR